VHLRFVFFAVVFSAIALAQDQAQDQNSADRSMAPAVTAPGAPGKDLIDRILDLTGPADPKPLTRKQAFHLYLLDTAGPLPIIGEAAGAGWGQIMNTPSAYGQGWDAYGKRFGANMGYNATRQTISYGLSLALHEDSRYFGSHAAGFWPRTRHALVSTFTARHPDGRDEFSVSSTAGVVGACMLSSIWGPPSWKSPGNIAANAAISFGATAGFNVVREFLPDILHRPRR
jgi:hypothetical protein